MSRRDSDLILAAPLTDAPALLTEVERLQGILARVEAARANHPECDRYGEGDPVACGWKSVVLDVDAALRGDA